MAGSSMFNSDAESLSWIQNIYKDDDADENEEMSRPVKLLGSDARRFTWWMCNLLKADMNGIPAQAIQILERFLASYLRLDDITSTEQLQQRRQDLSTKLPVIVAVCVWLATKMSISSEQRLNASIICMRLRQYSIQCTVKDLAALELDIFKRINYRIPLWTTVEKANMLASVVGFTGAMLKTVEHLTNLAEILRDQVQDHVIMIANRNTPDEGTTSTPVALRNIRNGHFCAAIVLSMTTLPDYVGPPSGYITQILVKLTKSSTIYLKSIAKAIAYEVKTFSDDRILPFKSTVCEKRRYEHVTGPSKRPRILR